MSNDLETLIVVVVAVAATFAAVSHIALVPPQAEEVVIGDHGTSSERCRFMRVWSVADQGQWPMTVSEEGAAQVIASLCNVDLAACESTRMVAVRR
jgi:hypothetical protein